MTATTTAAQARARLRATSNLCIRKLHDQCVAGICECECHGAVSTTRPAAPAAVAERKEPTVPTPGQPDPPPVRVGIELERCDPPPSRRGDHRKTDAILALVPNMVAAPGAWFRVATWPGKSSATSCAQTMRKLAPDIEWTGRAIDGGSGLWGRAPE